MFKKFIIVFTIFLTSAIAYSATEKKEYILGSHFRSAGGMGPAQLADIGNSIAKLFEENTNFKITIKKFPGLSEVLDAFVNNKIDIMQIWSNDAILLKDKGIEVLPLYSYTIDKREKKAMCLWQKKGKTYFNFSDIDNTTLLTTYESLDSFILEMEEIREYLYKNGVDKPLWNVFKNFGKLANPNSAFFSVGAGEGDFYWASDDYDFLLKAMLPNIYSHISHKFCTERIFDRWTFVINKKSIDNKTYKILFESVKQHFLNYEKIFKKDKNLRHILQLAKMAKADFYVSSHLFPYETEISLWEKSKKNGWYNEAKFLADVLLKVEMGKTITVKPTYEYCKPKCLKAKDQLACIEKCME